MSPDASHADLFKSSGVSDKIAELRSLLDSHDLTAEEALALLASIHADLKSQQGPQVY
jgi:hypothetical protein